MSANEPISAGDAYQGTGSNEELWPILVSHGAVSDPSDVRDSYLATVLINWRNAACKDVAGQYHEQRDCAEKAKAELAQTRESLELSEAQLVEVTLERAEWRKQAQQYEAVAKILRADLATAHRRAETAERELAEMRQADDENIGTEKRPLTKRELRTIGMAVVGPLKYMPDRWDHETVVKLYWALMQQRGEAMLAQRELAELRDEYTNLQDESSRIASRAGEYRKELAESLDALTVAAELIDRLTDDSPCDYDHHDNCRTHGLQRRPCPHPLGRQFVEAWRAVEAEEQKAADDDHQ